MIEGKIFITGGAGTLGRAIIAKANKEGWDCEFTIYSTDTMKHAFVRRRFPNVRSVIGDIRDYHLLNSAIAGHDVVIHAAAVKHIPVSEHNVTDTYQINVQGSENVALACIDQHVPICLGISTDKACNPHNAYGATKMLNEKMFQYFQWENKVTNFYLVRYGNVMESTGSVVQIWQDLVKQGKSIGIVDPEMTRFWLSPFEAVKVISDCLSGCAPGFIFIPKLHALSLGELADMVVPDAYRVEMPMRPGEKIHETLLTELESKYAQWYGTHYQLQPSILIGLEKEGLYPADEKAYTSENAPRVAPGHLDQILRDAKELDEIYGR